MDLDTLKRALSPVCCILLFAAARLAFGYIDERVYAGAAGGIAFSLTAFLAILFLVPRPMYDEDSGGLRWRCLAVTLLRLGKIEFAVFALLLAAGIAVTVSFWPKYTVAEMETRLAAGGYSDIALCTTLDRGSVLRPDGVVFEAAGPDGCRQRLLADLSDGSFQLWI